MSWKDATGRFAILVVLVVAMIGFLVFHQHQRAIQSPRQSGATAVSAQATAVDQIALLRMARDRAQSASVADLGTALAGTTSPSALLSVSLRSLQQNMRWETECEALLRSQGFGHVAVVIDDGRVELVVPFTLTQPKVAAMAALVQRVTGLPYESMTVLPAR